MRHATCPVSPGCTRVVITADDWPPTGYRSNRRYAQGTGWPPNWQWDEQLRLRAAERLAQGESCSVIVKGLRVSARSVQRWRRL
ncbi:helix-turn-helix domain-containing protein [Streptomyces glaucus]|uniref:helix-turn-helix domain-containing protein n=1 Tax=Streptomyces glaucus TaxID=284029 RepID=UPI0031DB1BB0